MTSTPPPHRSTSSGGIAPGTRAMVPLRSLQRLLSLTYPYKVKFIAALVALMIGSGMNLLFPEIVRRVLEPGVFPSVIENLPGFMLALAGLFVVQGGAFFTRSYLFGVIGQRVYADLRERLFRAIISKEIAFFDQNRSGDLAARINSDAALVQDAVAVKLSVIARYGLQVSLGIVLMAWMSWHLTVAIVVSVVCMVAVSALFLRSLRSASRLYQTNLARLTSFAAECFSGAKILRSLGAEGEVTKRCGAINQDTLRAGEGRVSISASFSSGASLLLNLLLLGVLWYGVHLVVVSALPLNELAAFVLYGAIVAVSFSFLIGAYTELMQAVGGLERVFELLEEERGREQEAVFPIGRVESLTVEFSRVSFSYPTRPDLCVVRGLSLTLAAGKMTALVGPSGAGKSSIVQLLLGLYNHSAGSITFNGAARGDLSEAAIREMVAWVPQEPELFGFSLFENLILGNKQLLRDEVLKIVQRWDFLDFIGSLADGIDTVLGEHGTLVSGGQRQRIAIARALLRRPALLILDEATSGLDSQTEARVMRAIRDFIPQATILIISHRLATVRAADTIYVINEGCVFERGTHRELAERPGLYQEYVMRQALG